MRPQNYVRVQVWFMLCIYCMLISNGSCNCAPATSVSDKIGSCNSSPEFVDSNDPNIICCMPCSQRYLSSSFFKKHSSLQTSDIQGFLAEEFHSHDSCKGILSSMSYLHGVSVLQRHLSGEGSHRHLVSVMRFDIQLDDIPWLNSTSCEVVLIELLPAGVFADPFELQHLVQRGGFYDAAVFGDTNVELPSALSNRSIVEVHLNIQNGLLKHQGGLEITNELPLHARYPHLDINGYSRVEIGTADVMMRLRHEDCSSVLINLNSRSAHKVVWQIACGNKALTGIVSGVTFASALVSAFLIVFAAIYSSSPSNDIKDL